MGKKFIVTSMLFTSSLISSTMVYAKCDVTFCRHLSVSSVQYGVHINTQHQTTDEGAHARSTPENNKNEKMCEFPATLLELNRILKKFWVVAYRKLVNCCST